MLDLEERSNNPHGVGDATIGNIAHSSGPCVIQRESLLFSLWAVLILNQVLFHSQCLNHRSKSSDEPKQPSIASLCRSLSVSILFLDIHEDRKPCGIWLS